MNRLSFLITKVFLIWVAFPLLVTPVQAQNLPISLGSHKVIKDETLYCIGRAYGVLPLAIAQANNLHSTARLSIGQVLAIPAVEWNKIPIGPVCKAQFQSPYIGTSTTTVSTPAPSAPSTQAPTVVTPTSLNQTAYIVQPGDTLWRIATRFKVTVSALQSKNNLGSSDLIYVGQKLIISDTIGTSPATITPTSTCPQGCTIPPPGCFIKGNISFNTGEKIYHLPGGQFYEATVIRPEYGELWFCFEEEAITNGWRKSEK